MVPIRSTRIGAPPATSIASSRERSRPTCRCRRQIRAGDQPIRCILDYVVGAMGYGQIRARYGLGTGSVIDGRCDNLFSRHSAGLEGTAMRYIVTVAALILSYAPTASYARSGYVYDLGTHSCGKYLAAVHGHPPGISKG